MQLWYSKLMTTSASPALSPTVPPVKQPLASASCSIADDTGLQPLHEELAEIVAFLHRQGWTPATSSNFSARLSGAFSEFSISISGLDKGQFTAQHFMRVDVEAQPVFPADARPSAEVLLHRAVYRHHSPMRCVLHTHSVSGVVLSMLAEKQAGLKLHGFEMQKAFQGISSHEESLWLPVFSNDQQMERLSAKVERYFEQSAQNPAIRCAPGFLLAGHGLYAWGETPIQAQRHIEAFEYLFTCILALKSHGYPLSS
jgi:methylthioribulose-1-phosphate dehydratase